MKNAGIWALLEGTAGPISYLVAAPMILSGVGVVGFGQWAVYLALIGCASLLMFGTSNAVLVDVGKRGAQSSPLAFELNSAVRENCLAVFVQATVIALLATAMYWACSKYLGLAFYAQTAKMLLVCGALHFVVQEVDTALSGALKATNRWGEVSISETVGRMLQIVGGGLITMATSAIEWLAVWHLFAQTGKVVWRLSLFASNAGEHRFRSSALVEATIRLMRIGRWMFMQSASALLLAHTDKLLIGAFLGASETGRYAACLHLASQLHSLPAAYFQINYGLLIASPEKSRESQLQRYKISWVSSILLACVLLLLAVIAGHTVLKLWLGTSFADQNTNLFCILCLGFASMTLSTVPHFGSLAVGQLKKNGILNAVGVLCVLAAMATLAKYGYSIESVAGSRILYGLLLLPLGFIVLAVLKRETRLEARKSLGDEV